MTIDEIVNYVMYTSHNTNPAVLRDLLNSVEGSDSLPPVSSTDNGKVLTVVEGAWTAAGAGGGLVLTLSMSGQSIISDHTFGEIKAAISAGQSLWLSVPTDEPGERQFYPPALVTIAGVAGGEIIMEDFSGEQVVLQAATDEDYPSASAQE